MAGSVPGEHLAIVGIRLAPIGASLVSASQASSRRVPVVRVGLGRDAMGQNG
jgi:hypothetical protein